MRSSIGAILLLSLASWLMGEPTDHGDPKPLQHIAAPDARVDLHQLPSDEPVSSAGSSTQPVPVSAVERAATYFEVPLIGAIGEGFDAQRISQAMNLARQSGATHVVLLIDSHGNRLAGANEIIRVMLANRDMKQIAFVKNADATASILAAACPVIVVHPDGRCGGAEDADQSSLAMLDPEALAAMEASGHNMELLEAFCNAATPLYATTMGGNHRVNTTPMDRTSVLIKPAGRCLTLTSSEAVGYGFARATCKTMGDVARAAGITQWESGGDAGWKLMQASTRRTPPIVIIGGPSEPTDAQSVGSPSRNEARSLRNLQTTMQTLKAKIAATKKSLDDMEVDHVKDRQKLGDNQLALAICEQAYRRRHNRVAEKLSNLEDELRECQQRSVEP